MSMNYYFKLKEVPKINIDIKGEIGNNILKQLNNKIESMSEIHICQTADGWKPLFQKNEYYSTIAELRGFYERNKQYLYIEDEYGVEKAWEDIERIINNNTGKRRYEVVNHCVDYSYDKESGIEFIKRVMDIDKDIIELTNKEILLLSNLMCIYLDRSKESDSIYEKIDKVYKEIYNKPE